MRKLVGAVAAVLLAFTVSGCGSDGGGQAEPSESPTEVAGDESVSTDVTDQAASSNDICALLTDEEVTAVLGAAYPGTGTTGSLDGLGGQCIWTDNPAGAYPSPGDGFSQLELVVFGDPGAAPPDAVEVGSSQIKESDNGVFFASTERQYWLRVTGKMAADPDLAGLSALAETIRERG